jgi:hypothetical protein
MTTKTTKMSQKIPNVFECICCDYNTSNKKDYNKHLLTRKHANNNANNGKNPQKSPNYKCEFCSKHFKDRAGLWRHNKKCNEETKNMKSASTNDEISKSDIIELLKQNQEFKELLTEQQNEIQGLHKQIIDSVKHNGNIVNQTINNNQKFNLNFFLNEQCKDAMNMSEFIENMKLDLTDLTETSRLGYVGGISRILVNKLQELDIYKRPLHCTDMKRETLYIKNNNEWSKENNSKDALNGLVNKVSNQNCRNIKQWTEEHPGYQVFDSPENMDYVRLTQAVLGGLGEHECKQFKDKIIRNVIKEVMVNKF